jgi:hypothetical protein
MSARRSSLSCAHLGALALLCALGCTMEQDLGRDEGIGSTNDPNQSIVDDTHAGFGAGWACPADGQTVVPGARDLACPLSLPIEGDACPFASSAPCAFDSSQKARAICVCTSDHRWSCLADVFFRPLRVGPVEGEACFAPVEVAMPCGAGETDCEITCRCVNGAYRCGR